MKIESNPSELSQAVKLLITLFNNISMLDMNNPAELENAVVILEDFIGGIEDRIALSTLSKKSVKTSNSNKKKSIEVQRRDQFKLLCHLNGSVFTVDIADIEKLQPLVTSLKNEIINGKLIHYVPTAIRDEKLTIEVELDGADTDKTESRFKENVSFHQVITVQAITKFGRELLVLRHQDEYNRTQTTLSPIYTDVMSCYRDSWSSLIDLVASLLVTYHAINGNLNRISCCNECGKLIYQNRAGCRSYCSTDCRVRHNQADENPIQRKCRRRQNAWVLNHIKAGQPNFLLKGQCKDCSTDLPGGQCKLIRERHGRLMV